MSDVASDTATTNAHDESKLEMKRRRSREKYREYYIQNLEKVRKAALERYYKRKSASGAPHRPVGRPRKYEAPVDHVSVDQDA